MADQRHLNILKKGVEDWNSWRQREPDIIPDLRNASLGESHLNHINLSYANLSSAHLGWANLTGAHLEHTNLNGANLQGCKLPGAHLEYANLNYAHLEQANLTGAYLVGANLQDARLDGTFLQRASLDDTTRLDGVTFGNTYCGFASLADIKWGGANLAVADWSSLKILGEECKASQRNWIEDYRIAVRANRQLAIALRDQGLSEEGDCFSYRAQILQRIVWRKQRIWGKYIFSYFLDIIAGYGYRPLRSLICYVLVIVIFALLYFLMGNYNPHVPLPEQLGETLVASLTSFHSRGLMATDYNDAISDLQAFVAAVEGILGLVIEFSLIATFTQRFFAK